MQKALLATEWGGAGWVREDDVGEKHLVGVNWWQLWVTGGKVGEGSTGRSESSRGKKRWGAPGNGGLPTHDADAEGQRCSVCLFLGPGASMKCVSR